MMNNQKGFTLIELVVVIVILGILAATALPRFIDLTGDAEAAAIKGVAGGLGSASAINYGGCAIAGNVATLNKCVAVSKCSDVGALLTPPLTLGAVASTTAYYLAADTASTVNGATVTCTIQKNKPIGTVAFTATYGAVGAAN